MRYPLDLLRKEAERAAFRSRIRIPGMDFDDLTQEAMMVMWLAIATNQISTADPKSAAAFLARAGCNRIKQLARAQNAGFRTPHDFYGRPLSFESLENVQASYRIDEDMDPFEPPISAVPPCHVHGDYPEGYDTEDPLCHNCPDKFSCLLDTPGKTLDADPEVRFVVNARGSVASLQIAYEVVMERMRRRVRLRTNKEPIPPELEVTQPLVMPPRPEARPAPVHSASGSLGAPVPTKPLPVPKRMPKPKTLSPAALDLALSRVKVGQPFPLEVGHVLVRRRPGGEPDVCVEIREDGFWLNLNQTTYGSLSSAAKAAECLFGSSYLANRPGNDYFNIAKRYTTEIRDAVSGAVLACRRGTR